jgi:hypothetical protein
MVVMATASYVLLRVVFEPIPGDKYRAAVPLVRNSIHIPGRAAICQKSTLLARQAMTHNYGPGRSAVRFLDSA